MPELAHATKGNLKTARRVELPAGTEVIVTDKCLTHAPIWQQRSATVTKLLFQSMALVIGAALNTPGQAETVIRVMNLTDKTRTLHRGTRIGEAHVITKCDRVEGLLPGTPRYGDDNEDSEDEGWLRDGRVKYHPAARHAPRAHRLPNSAS